MAKKCPDCGRTTGDSVKFCSECGHKFGKNKQEHYDPGKKDKLLEHIKYLQNELTDAGISYDKYEDEEDT